MFIITLCLVRLIKTHYNSCYNCQINNRSLREAYSLHPIVISIERLEGKREIKRFMDRHKVRVEEMKVQMEGSGRMCCCCCLPIHLKITTPENSNHDDD